MVKEYFSDGKILKTYLRDVGKHDILPPEVQRDYIGRAQRGDKKARDALVVTNLRLVVEIAKKYRYSGFSMQELVSEGSFGLFEAIEKFDIRRVNNFVSYAAWWVKYHIVRLLQQHGHMIRIPVNKKGQLAYIHKVEEELYQDETRYRKKKSKMVADRLNVSEKYVAQLKSMAKGIDSLDKEISLVDEGTVTKAVLVEDEKAEIPELFVLQSEEMEIVMRCLERIPERESRIIKERYGLSGGEKKSLRELSEECGLTKERIRQIETQGISRLRSMVKSMGLGNVAQ